MKSKTTANCHRTDLLICSHSRERKLPSYSHVNTVLQIFNVIGEALSVRF